MAMLRTLGRPYLVDTPDGRGVCYAWRYWGNERIRWYWVQLVATGVRKAYGYRQARPVWHSARCTCSGCQLVLDLTRQ